MQKHWKVIDVVQVEQYLQNTVANGEVVLRLRGRKGTRVTPLAQEVVVAVGALRSAVNGARSRHSLLPVWDNSKEAFVLVRKDGEPLDSTTDDEQTLINQAYEDWIREYLIEGGRDKLLTALRVRQHRAAQKETAEPQVETQPETPASKPQASRIERLANTLRKYTHDEVREALALVGIK